MVDYTLRLSCQGVRVRRAGICTEASIRGERNQDRLRRRRGRSHRRPPALARYTFETPSTRATKGVQGTYQARSDETARRRKALAGRGKASTFAAQLVAMLVQRDVDPAYIT